MTATRGLLLALGASVLLAHLGCLSASSPRRIAILRYTVELYSTSGALLADTPILVDTIYPFGSSERDVRTDSEG